MSAVTGGHLLVLQGGGPTPVLNTTLFAVIDEAMRSQRFARVLGARMGVEGLIRGELLNLSSLPAEQLQDLRHAPGAALGTSRHRITDADLEQTVVRLKEYDVRGLIVIGGNGSLRGAAMIAEAVDQAGVGVAVVGVPKTIDNDIVLTDRCPGFGSAARYVAQSVRDLGMDVRGLPQPVSIFETMGRSVGWLGAASVLAKIDEQHAPHLVYLPERAFDVNRFLGDVDGIVAKRGWAVVVVTEGLKTATGRPVYETPAISQRDALDRGLPGGVAAHLAEIVTQRLRIRCRWEKPGLCGRASMLHVAPQDRTDAELVGRAGVRAALQGAHAQMVALRPLEEGNETELVPLLRVGGGERTIAAEWLSDSPTSVAPPFEQYVRRIVGELVDYPVPLKDQSSLFS